MSTTRVAQKVVVYNRSTMTPMFLLFCIFLVLKLTGVIGWSWWWVTCPLWAGLAIGLGIMGICLVLALIFLIIGGIVAGLGDLFSR